MVVLAGDCFDLILPLDGGGLGGGERPSHTERVETFTPPQPLPIEGRGFKASC